MKNYYEILEVHPKASFETIQKVFKLQVKKYHPDIVKPEERKCAEEKLKELNEAYDILSNEKNRKEYDELIKNESIQNENEILLNQQIIELKEKLEKKEQIIEHFLGGLDLSEYENNPPQEHKKFKDEEEFKSTYNNSNDNNNEYYYNDNPKSFLEKVQNFFNPNRPYKNIYEHYIHILLISIIKILGVLIAMILFFSLISIFTNTNVFSIIFDVFFSSK